RHRRARRRAWKSMIRSIGSGAAYGGPDRPVASFRVRLFFFVLGGAFFEIGQGVRTLLLALALQAALRERQDLKPPSPDGFSAPQTQAVCPGIHSPDRLIDLLELARFNREQPGGQLILEAVRGPIGDV